MSMVIDKPLRESLLENLVRLQCAQPVEIEIDPAREELTYDIRWTPEAAQIRHHLESLLSLAA